MPEPKKHGGFHALEERIHQIEEEDARQATKSAPPASGKEEPATRDERKAPEVRK